MNIWLELFGYIGTALVLLSMMMTSIIRLRILNLFGSVISCVYALLVGAWPVMLLNAGMTAVNAVHLIRIKQMRKFCAEV